jgi:hypothetical protein
MRTPTPGRAVHLNTRRTGSDQPGSSGGSLHRRGCSNRSRPDAKHCRGAGAHERLERREAAVDPMRPEPSWRSLPALPALGFVKKVRLRELRFCPRTWARVRRMRRGSPGNTGRADSRQRYRPPEHRAAHNLREIRNPRRRCNARFPRAARYQDATIICNPLCRPHGELEPTRLLHNPVIFKKWRCPGRRSTSSAATWSWCGRSA